MKNKLLNLTNAAILALGLGCASKSKSLVDNQRRLSPATICQAVGEIIAQSDMSETTNKDPLFYVFDLGNIQFHYVPEMRMGKDIYPEKIVMALDGDKRYQVHDFGPDGRVDNVFEYTNTGIIPVKDAKTLEDCQIKYDLFLKLLSEEKFDLINLLSAPKKEEIIRPVKL